MTFINLKDLQNQKTQAKNLNFQKAIRSLKGGQQIINGFESKVFPIGNQTQEKGCYANYASYASQKINSQNTCFSDEKYSLYE